MCTRPAGDGYALNYSQSKTERTDHPQSRFYRYHMPLLFAYQFHDYYWTTNFKGCQWSDSGLNNSMLTICIKVESWILFLIYREMGPLVRYEMIDRQWRIHSRQFFRIVVGAPIRHGGGGGDARKFKISVSRFSWTRFKDDLHFYVMLGAVPIGCVIFYANFIIGKLSIVKSDFGYTCTWYLTHSVPTAI